jgi:hypothetical protein
VTIPPRTREGVRLIWARNEHHQPGSCETSRTCQYKSKARKTRPRYTGHGPAAPWHDMPHTFFFAPVALETALDVCFRHSSWNRAASVRCGAK